MPTLSHACVRVLDLARSVAFYRETLGLTPQRELTMEDRGWHLVFLGDGVTPVPAGALPGAPADRALPPGG